MENYVTQKSNMAPNIAANASEWQQVHNYWLKFDDLGVHSQVLGYKEDIKVIKTDVGLLSNTTMENGIKDDCKYLQMTSKVHNY